MNLGRVPIFGEGTHPPSSPLSATMVKTHSCKCDFLIFRLIVISKGICARWNTPFKDRSITFEFSLHLTNVRLHEQILGVRFPKLSPLTSIGKMQKHIGQVPPKIGGSVSPDCRAGGTRPPAPSRPPSPLSTPMSTGQLGSK